MESGSEADWPDDPRFALVLLRLAHRFPRAVVDALLEAVLAERALPDPRGGRDAPARYRAPRQGASGLDGERAAPGGERAPGRADRTGADRRVGPQAPSPGAQALGQLSD